MQALHMDVVKSENKIVKEVDVRLVSAPVNIMLSQYQAVHQDILTNSSVVKRDIHVSVISNNGAHALKSQWYKVLHQNVAIGKSITTDKLQVGLSSPFAYSRSYDIQAILQDIVGETA